MRPQSKQLQILIITIIVLLIPFCAYYIFYISSQTKYFTTRNFRLLAGISEQISLTITNLNNALCNAAKNIKLNKDKDTDREPHVSLDHIPSLKLIDEQYKTQSEETLKSYRDKLIPNIQLSVKQEWDTLWLGD